MTTDTPAPLPGRLADAERELPADVVKAIRHLTSVCMVAPGFNDATIANRNLRNGVEALTAAILASLTAAESAREAAVARAEKALDDACRMETIRLKVGELSPQEQQLASIVAGLIRGAVSAALAHPVTAEET